MIFAKFNKLNLINLFLFAGILSLYSCQSSEEQKTNQKTIDSTASKPLIKLEVSAYELSMQKQGLVNISEIDSNIMVDLKYSSIDNFFGEDVYGNLQNAYLQPEVAKALSISNTALMAINPNYRLIIYDGARPLSVQKILWEKLDTIPPSKRKDFVADPEEGSIHNYGCAVDLSIYDIVEKKALDMGTKYDYFGSLAYPRLENKMLEEGELLIEHIQRRQLLRKVLGESGFMPITSEWWHFNYYSRKKASTIHEIVL